MSPLRDFISSDADVKLVLQRPTAHLPLIANPISNTSPKEPVIAGTAYAERIAALGSLEAQLQREHVRLGYLRLIFGIAALPLLVPPTPLVLGPFLAFAVAAREHGKTLRKLAETRRALSFYRRCIARIEDRWPDLEVPEPAVDRATSLFAEDLDLFGKGSLFALLCETRTSLGRDLLAQWLLEPSPVTDVQQRQSAVADLRDRLRLREAFAAAPGPAGAPLDRAALERWASTPGPAIPRSLQWLAPMLVILMFLAAWRYAAVHSPLLLVVSLLLNASLTFRFRREVKLLFHEAERAARALRTVAVLLGHMEASDFTAQLLQRRCASLSAGRIPASRAVARLYALGQWADARTNYLVRLLDAPFLYSVQLGLAVQHWHGEFGHELRVWLEAVAEFEALLSLAGYSFEHPEDPFPEFTSDKDGASDNRAHFLATALGHPLLPRDRCKRNDVALGAGTQLMLVSGSNMSGKSTLLRSVGTNVVLAFAGAPVCARSLLLSPLTLAASIHVNDSLQAGRSRFYAEILRLRAIAEAARLRPPALFLIDEVLSGTNSGDRLAGAQGLVRALLRSGAVGLLSTHDLALTFLDQEANEEVRNVHFQDDVVNGELRFDYVLRDGPVTRSNGLALMRLIGLEV